ncbi:lachesin-like isoform X2 [Chrysoperla carnea]|uniref:lachesin-like isoform X2 n=1 Tax=Chrysoperla carnea TaxID=189513 RepID=UPI001D074C85|nr:lachesin-like isoform X2 [Chrysoperla carnea]
MYFFGFCVIFLGTFTLKINGQRPPAISNISHEQIKEIGGTAELYCSVQYAQEYPVLWIKYDHLKSQEVLPISSGSALIIRDSRLALRYDTASSTYTLQIKDIQETDAGVYECQIILSKSNKISAKVELHIGRKPIIHDNSTKSIIVSEGQPVQMECFADGYPSPKISWRRQNNEILPTGGSIYRGQILKITAIRKEDGGTYYCVAENGVGRSAKRAIEVHVESAPEIIVSNSSLSQALQYDMHLQCHIIAYPPPAVVWLKDGQQLPYDGPHYRISHFSTEDNTLDTILRVMKIEKQHFGKYVCKATNNHGSSEATIELSESTNPVCPPACGN